MIGRTHGAAAQPTLPCAIHGPHGSGRVAMHKLVIGSLVLMLCLLGWSASSVGEQPPAPRGELRVVDRHDSNWATIVLNIFEHLIESNQDAKLVPRLATGWLWRDERTPEVTLRQGVKFHNAEVFDAE